MTNYKKSNFLYIVTNLNCFSLSLVKHSSWLANAFWTKVPRSQEKQFDCTLKIWHCKFYTLSNYYWGQTLASPTIWDQQWDLSSSLLDCLLVWYITLYMAGSHLSINQHYIEHVYGPLSVNQNMWIYHIAQNFDGGNGYWLIQIFDGKYFDGWSLSFTIHL